MDETTSNMPTPIQDSQAGPLNTKPKKFKVALIILTTLVVLLSGALAYVLVTRDSYKDSPSNDQSNYKNNDNQNNNNQGGDQTNSKTVNGLTVTFSDNIWTAESKVGPTKGEAVEFRLKSNPNVGALLDGTLDSLGGMCSDQEPPATITKLGTTKDGLAIIEQSRDAVIFHMGQEAPKGLIYVTHIEFPSDVTTKTISCNESMYDWTLSDSSTAFTSLNPWSSLSSSEQTAVLELMSSLTAK
ncbi:MAG: hypothetical protein LBQ11_01755 [Candidatus Nomurabacteria bacterium]|jgi:hypothetical protein|nr:hypothetical protein [Candidatus Nomurabacteria bacterium]